MLISSRRCSALRAKLLAWWDSGHRDLPWRFPQHAADPYRVWLAEVMLQQTQVAAVVPYYRRFIARFPSLDALASAREEDVLALWSGLGYYARGRRLHAAAGEALRLHGGLPADRDALAALPGFGPYTAGAVASIAFGLRAPCVDGNVARVLARLFAVEGAPEAAEARARLWALAAELVPAERPGDFNQALMELGATVCGKPAPGCGRCPVGALCAARRAGREREIPAPRRRRDPKPLAMACALIERRGSWLVARRAPGGLFGGLWELPSAEVAAAADPRRALRVALRDRLQLEVDVGEIAGAVDRVLTHRLLRLTAYRCRAARSPRLRPEMAWARADDLDRLAFPMAMRQLVVAALEG